MSEQLHNYEPHKLHAKLSALFLDANSHNSSEGELDNIFSSPPLLEFSDGKFTVRDTTHSFHAEYFGQQASETSSANMYETRRQKRIQFLRNHQSFFEIITHVGRGEAQPDLYVVGSPAYYGESSLSTLFVPENEAGNDGIVVVGYDAVNGVNPEPPKVMKSLASNELLIEATDAIFATNK